MTGVQTCALPIYQDLEKENSQLKDRLFRTEMEMQEERERWKAEKKEVMRRSEKHLEEMSINRAMMEQQVRDVESENLQLKERLSRMEMEMKQERERWVTEKEEMMKITKEFMLLICSSLSTMGQNVRVVERERDIRIEKGGDEKELKERKKEGAEKK